MSWVKKAQAAKVTKEPKDVELVDDVFSKAFPALAEFMTALKVDGDPRELSKVQIFAQGGVWKAALHDTNTEASLFVTLTKPQEAFAVLNKALQADAPDWRFWGQKEAKKKGKGA